jgi:hypothetical protein
MVATTPAIVSTVFTCVRVVLDTGVAISLIHVVSGVVLVVLLLAVFTVIEVTTSFLSVSGSTGFTSILSVQSDDVNEVIVCHSPVCLIRVDSVVTGG